MSVRMALAKLCACACGGAVIGGGAVHVAEGARSGYTQSVKKKTRYVRRVVQRPVKRITTTTTTTTTARPKTTAAPRPTARPTTTSSPLVSGFRIARFKV